MRKLPPLREIVARENHSAAAFKPVDAALLALLVAFALFLMARAGFRRGVELMPWPDGLEYAAAAVNVGHGLGPVLHFGGYSYPSRYTEGYPLILAAAYPLLGHRVDRLCLVTVAAGVLCIAALYVLTVKLFGRASAFLAALMLVASPLFVTYSTLVLSDVPTLAVTLLAANALLWAAGGERPKGAADTSIAAWAILGLLAGLSVIIRPTNAAILVGLAVALLVAPPAGGPSARGHMPAACVAFAVGFAIFPLWQAWENISRLGGPFRSGYVFWVPEVYGLLGKTFGARFLFGPTMPRNPHGNLVFYLFALLGLDGMLGGPGDPYYFLYPFAAAAFAAGGIAAALGRPRGDAARRIIWFGLGLLATLLAVYLPYFFTDAAFILPASFVVFVAAGYGAVVMNRRVRALMSTVSISPRKMLFMPAVLILDVLLGATLATQTWRRLAASPAAPSQMVASLISVQRQLAPGATVISNISLQFLALYLAAPEGKFVGLNSLDPGQSFTDYHLHRLYAKRARGWDGTVPPTLFGEDGIDEATMQSLVEQAHAGRPLYLLLGAPESLDYARRLGQEVTGLDRFFALEALRRNESIALYRLTARREPQAQRPDGTALLGPP